MKKKKLDKIKAKRIKGIFCWMDYGSYSDKLFAQNGHFKNYFNEIISNSTKLISLNIGSSNTSTINILLKILRDDSYSIETIPLIEFLDFEYRKYNDSFLKDARSNADDFWINSVNGDKWRIWDDSYLTDY
jgi:hypothetical protein